MTAILATPPSFEQLPPYCSIDPETASVSSRAPSYVSAAPSYDHATSPRPTGTASGNITTRNISRQEPRRTAAASSGSTNCTLAPSTLFPPLLPSPSASQQAQPSRAMGLPNLPFAEGFVPRLPGCIPPSIRFDSNGLFSSRRPGIVRGKAGSSASNGGSSSNTGWTSTLNSHASRQYQAVARRRAREGRDGGEQGVTCGAVGGGASVTSNGLTNTTATGAGSGMGSGSTGLTSGSASTAALRASTKDESTPNPLEDPYLVGEEAAKKARDARVYREVCAKEAETMRAEGKVSSPSVFIVIQSIF